MGRITGAFIMPHPPVMIPEVGRGREREAENTYKALIKAARDIYTLKPDTIILTSPHGPFFDDFFYMPSNATIKGDMSDFGRPDISLEFKNDGQLGLGIIESATLDGFYCGDLEEKLMNKMRISSKLDHGAFVPLYFINREYKDRNLPEFIRISVADMTLIDLYRFGMSIKNAVRASDKKVVFVASGDMSHCLTQDAPAGFDAYGSIYDQRIVELIKNNDIEGFLDIKPSEMEKAKECGTRSFSIMFGALDKNIKNTQVYSYEGPFGVGYLVAKIETNKDDHGVDIPKTYREDRKKEIQKIREKEDKYVLLAREALEEYIKHGKIIKPSEDEDFRQRAGVFVSLKKDNALRGCIGTINPVRKNIGEEIVRNAISSGTEDPRFDQVAEDELDYILYSVDILSEPEPIEYIGELDPLRYGVIVTGRGKKGLLLPNLEGIDTPEEQVEIALKKAGISDGESYSMERFEVVRHGGKG